MWERRRTVGSLLASEAKKDSGSCIQKIGNASVANPSHTKLRPHLYPANQLRAKPLLLLTMSQESDAYVLNVDENNYLVNADGEYVDNDGNVLPQGADPVLYEEDDGDDDVVAEHSSPVTSPKGKELAGAVETPIAPPPKHASGIPMKKNPFTTSFTWSRETFAEVKVNVPAISHADETTNDQTRANNPDNRYWKVTVDFTFNNYTNDTIRIENVLIPHSTSRNYGGGYVYAAFPIWLRSAVLAAAKLRRPTIADDPSLQSNEEQWWKTVNFKATAFGIQGKESFSVVPLQTLFMQVKNGVTATLVVRIFHKASTMGRQPLQNTDMGKISIDVIRGYLTGVNVDMPGAPRIIKSKEAEVPPAFAKDIATESLVDQLARLGL